MEDLKVQAQVSMYVKYEVNEFTLTFIVLCTAMLVSAYHLMRISKVLWFFEGIKIPICRYWYINSNI